MDQKALHVIDIYPSGWYITLTLLWADDAPSRAALTASSKKLQKTLPGPHQPLRHAQRKPHARLTQAVLNTLDIARVVLQPHGYRPLRYFFLFMLSP